MALIKSENVDDSTESTDTDFPDIKNEAIEIDDSNLWAKDEKPTCGPQGISFNVPVKSEPVNSSLEDWDGYGCVRKKDLDESESGNELENPLFVTVKEEPDDEALFGRRTLILGDSALEELVNVKKEQVYDSNAGSSSEYQPVDIFQVNSNKEASTSGEATYSEHREHRSHKMGPITNSNKLLGDACCAFTEHHSEGPNCCHHFNSIGAGEVNPSEYLFENRSQCLCKIILKMRSTTEHEIPCSIASTSEVKKRIYKSTGEEGEIEQSGDMQMIKIENEKSVNKSSEKVLQKLSVADHKVKQNTTSINTSSKQISLCPTGEETFKCSQCEKTFNKKSNLTRHVGLHTEEKLFKCNQCEKSFHRKGNYTRHMQGHKGEKPFKCNQCEKSFTERSKLTIHMRQHTGEKPFKCNACGKSFTRKDILAIHMRQHNGEKPFKCNVCKKAYVDKRHLTRHIQTHINK